MAGAFFDQREILKLLNFLGARNHVIAASVAPGERLPSDQMGELLDINMQLRRLFDATASRYVESFDSATKPIMDWDWIIDRELEADL